MGMAVNLDTLPKRFESQMKALGDKIALREKSLGRWRPITWREYYDHVESFSLGLVSLGLKPGERVAILGENCPEWLYADLAAQSARGVAVGVYPTNSAKQVKYILENSDSRYVVVRDQEQLDKILEIKDELPLLRRAIVIDMKGVRKYKDPIILSYAAVEEIGKKMSMGDPSLFRRMISETDANDIAITVYTSGTTGPPKGAMLSHKNIVAAVECFFKMVPVSQTDSLVSALPLCHVAERLFSLFIPLKAGCTINFAEGTDTLQADMIEISPTIFLTVPRILEKLQSAITTRIQDADPVKRWVYKRCMQLGEKVSNLELSGNGVNLFYKALYAIAYFSMFRALRNRMGLLQVRECVSGAAPLSIDVMKFFRSIGFVIKETYGMTETAGVFTMSTGESIKVGSVGKPVEDIEFKLAEDGEILLKGDSVFVGYYHDQAGTERVKKDGWLYTGDVGKLDDEGNLYIVDRKKEIIITASGKNIAPSEIENSLKFSPYIREAIVIGEGKSYLTALVQIDYENVANWAQKEEIPFTTYKSLARNERVCKLIEAEIRQVNEKFSRVESIKKFRILEKELDHDDDEVTATMKVRRQMIEAKYKELISSMYQ